MFIVRYVPDHRGANFHYRPGALVGWPEATAKRLIDEGLAGEHETDIRLL